MKVIETIAKLGLQPLNTVLVMALTDNTELRPHWMIRYKYKNDSIITVETKHIDPYMLYYGFEQGHYVFNTKHGLATSFFSRDEYLKRLKQNEFLTVVTLKKHIVFGVFHDDLPPVDKLYKIAEAVDSERDGQRQRLYRWQHWYDARHEALQVKLRPKQVKKMVFSILQDYSFDLTRVYITNRWNKRNKKAIALHRHMYESKIDHSTFMMLLYEFDNTNVGTVLHEIAHSIVLTEYAGWKGPVAGHGPEYCLILAELFHRYADIPIEKTYASMVHNKLKVAPIEDFFDGKKYQFYSGLDYRNE